MFIHNRTIKIHVAPINHHTGIAHRARQCNTLRHSHFTEKNRHRKRGNLPFRDGVIRHTLNEEVDFIVGENFTITLSADNFLR
ncbi:Uncharacterised protein [Vibrio cholerae]|uniref:Uncharacterized protein n=1 Tax=Vibrio cholerae TaxID=666 RepID=A0A655SUK3_VIBCL|nr:Uncharacterised protein [Vibrio cholerae]CSB36615.1 Uncharacterised protein [Vibrio cholerae]CSC76192.1 Uncharacterised protein [Vibrio cholerae]CSC79738.1 Uncharacterised protein [Vibrio cholerae]